MSTTYFKIELQREIDPASLVKNLESFSSNNNLSYDNRFSKGCCSFRREDSRSFFCDQLIDAFSAGGTNRKVLGVGVRFVHEQYPFSYLLSFGDPITMEPFDVNTAISNFCGQFEANLDPVSLPLSVESLDSEKRNFELFRSHFFYQLMKGMHGHLDCRSTIGVHDKHFSELWGIHDLTSFAFTKDGESDVRWPIFEKPFEGLESDLAGEWVSSSQSPVRGSAGFHKGSGDKS